MRPAPRPAFSGEPFGAACAAAARPAIALRALRRLTVLSFRACVFMAAPRAGMRASRCPPQPPAQPHSTVTRPTAAPSFGAAGGAEAACFRYAPRSVYNGPAVAVVYTEPATRQPGEN